MKNFFIENIFYEIFFHTMKLLSLNTGPMRVVYILYNHPCFHHLDTMKIFSMKIFSMKYFFIENIFHEIFFHRKYFRTRPHTTDSASEPARAPRAPARAPRELGRAPPHTPARPRPGPRAGWGPPARTLINTSFGTLSPGGGFGYTPRWDGWVWGCGLAGHAGTGRHTGHTQSRTHRS